LLSVYTSTYLFLENEERRSCSSGLNKPPLTKMLYVVFDNYKCTNYSIHLMLIL
jgi:hypothetical protein